ncbi:AAA family ATPase [Zobellia laminariae]|uniref:AAA family ATPase n=1 Tax=Zobellia laminariae TaxID=248906 RepID=UPI0012D9661A|nr:LuxR family transcriptional regulator [Zobellia laminariae]
MELNEENLTNPNNNIRLGKLSNNILMDKMANEWLKIASKIEDPKPLFGNIWHQGEVGILFSNTGKGKSILAVQLADAISKGTSLLGLNSKQYKVLYFDFELSTKAFQQRYSEGNDKLYNFSDQFIRVEIDRNENLESGKDSFEELIINSIKDQVKSNKAEVIIIDNITFLSASNEKSHEALALMKLILDLSRKDNLSILLIAHTPKRDIYRPIQLEDLAGSKALSNFVDVCFCIGESIQGNNIRYIKQLKNRSYPVEYGQENVIDCQIDKKNCFLKFHFNGFSSEKQHLQGDGAENRFKEAKDLKNSGKTNVEIAKQFEVSEKTIRRWLKKI